MKIKRAKHGAIVKNKVNGNIYEIREEGGKVFAVNDAEEKKEMIEITENNAIVFRVVMDAEPEIPNAELHGNVLRVDGNSIESGFEFERILAKIPGAVFLLSGKSIIGYWPAVDKFKLIAEDVEDLFEKAVEDSIVFAVQREETEKKEISEGTYQEETHYSCGVIHVRNGNNPKIERYDPVDDFRIEGVSFDGKHSLLNGTRGTRGTRSDDSHVTLLDGEYLLEGKYTSAAETFYAGKRLLLKGDGMVLFSEYETEEIIPNKAINLAKELNGFDLLVDITYAENVTIYALANEAYEVKFLSKKVTKDRGTIYTIS